MEHSSNPNSLYQNTISSIIQPQMGGCGEPDRIRAVQTFTQLGTCPSCSAASLIESGSVSFGLIDIRHGASEHNDMVKAQCGIVVQPPLFDMVWYNRDCHGLVCIGYKEAAF